MGLYARFMNFLLLIFITFIFKYIFWKNVYNMKVKEPYFSHIYDDRKIIEGVINDGKWKKLKKGDIIKICNNNVEFFVKVVKINFYPPSKNRSPLLHFLSKERLKNIYPGIKTINEAENIYMNEMCISGEYEKFLLDNKIKKLGFLGIHMKFLI